MGRARSKEVTWVRQGECPPERCQGRCCEHVGIWLGDDALPFVQVLKVRGIQVLEDKRDLMGTNRYLVKFPQRCQHLTDDGLCGIYGKAERPQFCSDWPQEPAQLINDNYCGFSFVWSEEPAETRS